MNLKETPSPCKIRSRRQANIIVRRPGKMQQAKEFTKQLPGCTLQAPPPVAPQHPVNGQREPRRPWSLNLLYTQ